MSAALRRQALTTCDERAQVERLQRKFATIHSTLAQQHAQKPALPAASPAALRTSVPSSVNVSESFPKVGPCARAGSHARAPCALR